MGLRQFLRLGRGGGVQEIQAALLGPWQRAHAGEIREGPRHRSFQCTLNPGGPEPEPFHFRFEDSMAGQNRFHALQKWATKEMKLQQGRNMAHLEPGALLAGNVVNHVPWDYETYNSIKGGICASLVADWLKEKVQGTNSMFSRSPKAFTAGATDEKNAAKVAGLMRSAAPGQAAYKQSGSMDALFKANGLFLDKAPAEFDKGPPPAHLPMINIERSFTALCEGSHFRRGVGLVMSVSFRRVQGGTDISGHAVGAYKSNAGQVYFFDPNVGIYQLNRFSDFIVAWVSAYESLGMKITMDRPGDGFYLCDD
jgi:hypothetical protein